uniref:Uncharacterized protein n=1 Tax=Dictyoglomus turgidum TaxID=513050 RepID=A0A7C3WX03_9BACT
MALSQAQQYFVDLLRSHLSMREVNAKGSSYKLSAVLGDEELWEDFRLGLNYFNTTPPVLTTFSSEDLYQVSKATISEGGDPNAPEREDIQSILITPVIMCALFFTGMRLQWFEAGKHFRYSDNGISIERAKQQDYANIVNGDILAYLNNQLLAIKKALGFKLLKSKGLWSGMISMPRSLTRGLRGTRIGFGG